MKRTLLIITIIVLALCAGSCKKYATDAELLQTSLQRQTTRCAAHIPAGEAKDGARRFSTCGNYQRVRQYAYQALK